MVVMQNFIHYHVSTFRPDEKKKNERNECENKNKIVCFLIPLETNFRGTAFYNFLSRGSLMAI